MDILTLRAEIVGRLIERRMPDGSIVYKETALSAGTLLGGQVFGRQWFIASATTRQRHQCFIRWGRQSRWRTTTARP
jgi:hypothetical protein